MQGRASHNSHNTVMTPEYGLITVLCEFLPGAGSVMT